MSVRRQTSSRLPRLKFRPPRRFIKLVLIVFGVALAVFPQLYRQAGSAPPAADFSTPGPTLIPTSASTASSSPLLSGDPIKIDPGLLSPGNLPQSPVRILIPGLNIDLPVIEAQVVNGYWELSESTASHGVGSANPGQIGNTVIFAHAREGLFLPLRRIKIGDPVYVLTDSRWYRYSVDTLQFVAPSQTSVISPSPDEILTLFTGSGFLDSQRLIVTARPSR